MNDEIVDKKQLLADAVAKARADRKPDEGSGLVKAGGPKELKPDSGVKILGPQDIAPEENKKKLFTGIRTKPGRGIPEDPKSLLGANDDKPQAIGEVVNLQNAPEPAVVKPAANREALAEEERRNRAKPQIIKGHRKDNVKPFNPGGIAKDERPQEGLALNTNRNDNRQIEDLSNKKQEQVVASIRQDSGQRSSAMAYSAQNRPRKKKPVEKIREPAAASLPIGRGSLSYESTMPVYTYSKPKSGTQAGNDGTLKFR